MSRQSATIVLVAALLVAFGPVPVASAFDISRATTETEVVDPAAEDPVLQMELEAELDRIPALARADVVATWEQAGGVSPVPFVVTTPAECFVPNRTGSGRG